MCRHLKPSSAVEGSATQGRICESIQRVGALPFVSTRNGRMAVRIQNDAETSLNSCCVRCSAIVTFWHFCHFVFKYPFARAHCHFLCLKSSNLQAQLPTRRFLRVYLHDSRLLERCSHFLSVFYFIDLEPVMRFHSATLDSIRVKRL